MTYETSRIFANETVTVVSGWLIQPANEGNLCGVGKPHRRNLSRRT